MNKPENNLRQKPPPSLATQSAIGLGYQFIAAMIFFVGIGYYLDIKLAKEHLFTLVGVAISFVYGGYEVYKLVRLINQENKGTKPNYIRYDDAPTADKTTPSRDPEH